jgi:hypothetical protein
MLKLFKVFEINTRRKILYKVDFIFQDNMINHLRDKELVTTTKPQEPINLTIDNSQFWNYWDFGMNIRHVNHSNIYRLWFRMFVTDMAGYISRTRSKKLQEKPLEVQNVFGYMPLAKESWSGYPGIPIHCL